ncbi:MAG: hypothetical protein QOJ38_2013 [Solirubrobacterales bacterium]|jgi:hypothetical protein|nr:hypothetical protein [Solirubrobacterales bacterium]
MTTVQNDRAVAGRDKDGSAARWRLRLANDAARANAHQTDAQREITETLRRRAQSDGATAFALTGSTARNSRTAISDLDYHIVGPRPAHDDLPADVDIYAIDPKKFWMKLRSGDDFVQWTVRYGCILFDKGIFEAASRVIDTEYLWPDPTVKFARLPTHIALASQLIAMRDEDAALDQVRATLTSTARGALLASHVFPLSRSELPGQLNQAGLYPLAEFLERSIYSRPSLHELALMTCWLEDFLEHVDDVSSSINAGSKLGSSRRGHERPRRRNRV